MYIYRKILKRENAFDSIFFSWKRKLAWKLFLDFFCFFHGQKLLFRPTFSGIFNFFHEYVLRFLHFFTGRNFFTFQRFKSVFHGCGRRDLEKITLLNILTGKMYFSRALFVRFSDFLMGTFFSRAKKLKIFEIFTV